MEELLDYYDALPLKIAMARVEAATENGMIDLKKLEAFSPKWYVRNSQ